MLLTSQHLISLGATLAAVTLLGIYASRRVHTADDFSVGGRASGASIVFGAIIGTIIGGSATIGTAQLAFSVGLSAWWFTLGAGIALLVLAVFYAKPLRRSGLETIPQYLVANYGKAAGLITSITSSVGIFFSIVANLLAAAPLLSAVFSLNPAQSAGVALLIVVAYVFFGGVWGAGLVGILKTVLIYLTLITAAVLTGRDMGGVSGFAAAFPAFPWFSLFGRGASVDIGSGLSLLVGTLSTQTYIQAIYSARDEKAARRGALMAALVTLPAGIPAVMAGLYMRAYHPEIAPIDALPMYIIEYMPPLLGGVAIGALLLAAIGSAAGLALGVGTMLSRDIFGGVFGWNGGTRMLWLNRLIVLAITCCAALFTFGNMQSMVLEWNFLSMSLRGAGVFLPLTLAVFYPKSVAPRYAVASMIGGAAVALVWKVVFPEGLDPLYAGLIFSGGLLLIGCLRCQHSTVAEDEN